VRVLMGGVHGPIIARPPGACMHPTATVGATFANAGARSTGLRGR
jgi:hypothetical protein